LQTVIVVLLKINSLHQSILQDCFLYVGQQQEEWWASLLVSLVISISILYCDVFQFYLIQYRFTEVPKQT